MIIFQILIVVGVLYGIYRLNKLGKFTKKPSQPSVPTNTAFYPCILDGTIDMPPMADVIKAARIDVEAAKEYLTSVGKYRDNLSDQECMDLCSMPVLPDGVRKPTDNQFGGGGPFGGRYLAGGAFHIEIGADGQRIDESSWISIFSPDHFSVTGGMHPDGTLGLASMSIGGVPISGKIVDGKIVDGRATHGGGATHIYGVLNGTYRKV